MELIVNRYGETTPTAIQSNGVAISTPIYIQLTKEQNKTILNTIRTAISREGDAVVSELGVSEANLRHLLFARNGLPERLLLKLQDVPAWRWSPSNRLKTRIKAGLLTCISSETSFSQSLLVVLRTDLYDVLHGMLLCRQSSPPDTSTMSMPA